MAAPDPRVVAIVEAFGERNAAIRTRIVELITRLWQSLGSWRDADIERLATNLAPLLDGAQIQVAGLTDAYLAAIETAVLGKPARPVGIDLAVVTTEAMRGISTRDLLLRAGPTVWTALAAGATIDEAQRRGLFRTVQAAQTNLQLAKTHASRSVLERKPTVVGYRRTLTGSRSCGLCVVASTQRYHKADLLPVHPGCDCGVAPVFATRDPGQIIDPDTLDGVHNAIAERFGAASDDARSVADYRDALIVHNHGELGPVLGVRGQAFTGPDDI